MNREAFVAAHPDVVLLDVSDPAGVSDYLVGRGVLSADEPPIGVRKAGEGNMNCVLRVTTPRRSLIVKQARPWVEKYQEIAAPWDRSRTEAAFYEAVAGCHEVANRMPRLVYADGDARVLVLEDLGGHGDFTSLYAGANLSPDELASLVAYLVELPRVSVPPARRALFANREMRALNHEHIFHFPLVAANGLALDGITPGLLALADELKRDTTYRALVAVLGERYLADGHRLVHGDFFPGSWLRSDRGVAVIDPEFCFLGCGEFDVGVMIAHLMLANQPSVSVEALQRSMSGTCDQALALQYAGVEIMRRLIGLAQLPLQLPLERKAALLARSRQLVLGL